MIKNKLGEKEEKKDFFLKFDGTLSQRHNYWHQVQAEILAANVDWADFVGLDIKRPQSYSHFKRRKLGAD